MVYLPLWKIWVRQLELLFPIYGKIKAMFQSTKQLRMVIDSIYSVNNHLGVRHGICRARSPLASDLLPDEAHRGSDLQGDLQGRKATSDFMGISWGFHGDFIGITDLNGSNGVYDTVSKLYDSTISGWWLTYPSEQKWWTSSVGMTFHSQLNGKYGKS